MMMKALCGEESSPLFCRWLQCSSGLSSVIFFCEIVRFSPPGVAAVWLACGGIQRLLHLLGIDGMAIAIWSHVLVGPASLGDNFAYEDHSLMNNVIVYSF